MESHETVFTTSPAGVHLVCATTRGPFKTSLCSTRSIVKISTGYLQIVEILNFNFSVYGQLSLILDDSAPYVQCQCNK